MQHELVKSVSPAVINHQLNSCIRFSPWTPRDQRNVPRSLSSACWSLQLWSVMPLPPNWPNQLTNQLLPPHWHGCLLGQSLSTLLHTNMENPSWKTFYDWPIQTRGTTNHTQRSPLIRQSLLLIHKGHRTGQPLLMLDVLECLFLFCFGL